MSTHKHWRKLAKALGIPSIEPEEIVTIATNRLAAHYIEHLTMLRIFSGAGLCAADTRLTPIEMAMAVVNKHKTAIATEEPTSTHHEEETTCPNCGDFCDNSRSGCDRRGTEEIDGLAMLPEESTSTRGTPWPGEET
jgi:hypothetical protein